MSDIDEIQKKVDQLIQQFGGYWPPLSMLAAIIEEVGELAREMNAIEGYKPKKSSKKQENLNPQGDLQVGIKNIGEELGDLLFSIICVSNYFHINLDKEFNQILKKYKIRDKSRYSPKQ